MPSSYVPHPFLHFTEKMTFSERLYNTFATLFEDVAYHLVQIPNQRRLYNKYFPNAKRSFDEMYKESAIIFMNTHISSSSARPFLPNMVEIGGVHIEKSKPLPNDIQKFLDSAEEGAILFSMGSIIQAVQWPQEKREAFIKAFGKLKQKVLWKYENDTLPNKPSNVMISKWIPQRDILAHPNVKLFMTHGGLLGTSEAMMEGVPVLGFPIFGDQKLNMAKAVARDYGLQIFFDDISEESVSANIHELLNNPKYRDNAKLISSRFSDRPMTPQETVVYWTEYAVRHKGAPHLRAAGNSLNFIQFHSIDVYAVLAVVGFIFLYIDYLVLKFLLAKVFKKKTKVDIKKKTK
jgi:glucuronosyltransferase